MAKDDYDVIVYRVLVYLYGCLKREIMFEDVTFQAAVRKDVISETYFAEVLEMMQGERLIKGLTFSRAWGGDVILASDIKEAKITAEGARYPKENNRMKVVGDSLKEAVDIIAKLASILMIV